MRTQYLLFMVRKYLFVLSVVQNLFFGFSCSLISKNRTNLHTPLFQKKNFCMISSCSPVFSELFFYSTFFSTFSCFELLCRNLSLLFCSSLVSFFRFMCLSVFFSPVCSFFGCLHIYCEHSLVRIVFF